MFVVGSANCDDGRCNRGEVMCPSLGTATDWAKAGDFTYQSKIYGNALVFHQGYFYTFAGHNDSGPIRQVGRVAENGGYIGSWQIAGSLNSVRYGHRAIWTKNNNQGAFLVIGGQGDQPTEQCQLFGSQLACVNQKPLAENFHFWPELFNVPASFCK